MAKEALDALKALGQRKSVRSYLDIPLNAEALDRMVQAAQQAPCAGNFRITVIQNREILERLNEIIRVSVLEKGSDFMKERVGLDGYQSLHGAPAVFFLSGGAKDGRVIYNTTLAAENIITAATALGLGSCFLYCVALATGGSQAQTFRELTNIPPTDQVYCAVAAGETEDETLFSRRNLRQRISVEYIY